MIHLYRWQDEPNTITLYSDSDWAGCQECWKSTSVACFFHAYSKTQACIALWSAEVEYYSMVKTASERIGLKACRSRYSDPTSQPDRSRGPFGQSRDSAGNGGSR